MSSSTPGETSSPFLDLESILDCALTEYKKTTGRELLEHPLAADVKRCDSVDAISAILRRQASGFRRFDDSDQKFMRWIDPIVRVLSTFSGTLDGVASMVCLWNSVRNHPLKHTIMLFAGVPPHKRHLYWHRSSPCCPYLRCCYSWILHDTDVI
jgi:hypothetical protein